MALLWNWHYFRRLRGANGIISKGINFIMSLLLTHAHTPKLIYSHDRSLCKNPRYTKEPSIKNRLFSSLTKMTLSSAFSQNFMTGYLRKEACVADWHSQSAPSTGSGKKQWPNIIIMQDRKLEGDNWGLHRQLTTKGNLTWKSPLILQTFHG